MGAPGTGAAIPQVAPAPPDTGNSAAPAAPGTAGVAPPPASTQTPPRMATPPGGPAPGAAASVQAPYVPPPPPPVVRAPVPPAPPSPPVSGLPADAPKLVINGGTYSEQPGLRMVIVNGRVAKEGTDLGSGVVLQQIRPSSVVLSYKGAQYNIWY